MFYVIKLKIKGKSTKKNGRPRSRYDDMKLSEQGCVQVEVFLPALGETLLSERWFALYSQPESQAPCGVGHSSRECQEYCKSMNPAGKTSVPLVVNDLKGFPCAPPPACNSAAVLGG